jgi:CubicO group peptidase (beta-lactamase class C family)
LAADPLAKAVEQHLGTAVEISGQPAEARSLADAMAKTNVPGLSVAVIRGGKIVWTKGYGVVDQGGAAVDFDTRFQAGSISKSIAALAILKLAAAGQVSLDTPVNDYLTHWKLPDGEAGKAQDVTLRRLLSHTGGTNVHAFPGYARGGPVPSLTDVLDGKPPANTPAVRITNAPGQAWHYSGGGYAIAQQLVADVTKRDFADWVRDGWLRAAGMTASDFAAPRDEGGIALGHGADGAVVAGGYHLYPATAAAGLWTTPADLARAMTALTRSLKGEAGAPLPAAMARVTFDPVVPGHSVGFDTGGTDARWISKGGDTEGFAAYLAYYPERGDGAVVMTNGAQGSALARDVVRAVATAEGWPDFGPHIREAAPPTPALLAALPGTYLYRGANEFTIERSGDTLTIASPGETPERLYRDPSGAFFTLSQDVDFLFDDGAAAGRIKMGDTLIEFRKKDT